MADSPEHKFIAESLDRALKDYSDTRLLGLFETDRRRFDYGCLVLRDASRPLISQVLWGHEEGLEKDIRTLVFEGGPSLKIYFVRDKTRNRAKIDEVLASFRGAEATRGLLRGLRIIPVPEDFDADSPPHRSWMDQFILDSVSSDLLFSVVFGKLAPQDVQTFALHGGPLGLKIAALHLIDCVGYQHGPTFQERIGSKGPPLREAITMLTALGFVASPGFSVQRVPTLKGRFLLDLARLLAFERRTLANWSDETKLILSHLKLDPGDGWQEELQPRNRGGPVSDILSSVDFARRQFGIDIMENIDSSKPQFYSEFSVSKFLGPDFFGITPAFWEDADDVAKFGKKS